MESGAGSELRPHSPCRATGMPSLGFRVAVCPRRAWRSDRSFRPVVCGTGGVWASFGGDLCWRSGVAANRAWALVEAARRVRRACSARTRVTVGLGGWVNRVGRCAGTWASEGTVGEARRSARVAIATSPAVTNFREAEISDSGSMRKSRKARCAVSRRDGLVTKCPTAPPGREQRRVVGPARPKRRCGMVRALWRAEAPPSMWRPVPENVTRGRCGGGREERDIARRVRHVVREDPSSPEGLGESQGAGHGASPGDGGRSLETGGRRATVAAAQGSLGTTPRRVPHRRDAQRTRRHGNVTPCRPGGARGTGGPARTRAGPSGDPAERKGSAQGSAPSM